MLRISREQQLNDDRLRDACRILFWELWLLTFPHETLNKNYAAFNSRWRNPSPQALINYQSASAFVRILFGYSNEDLLKNRENYYCGRPTFFSGQIEAKFGYSDRTLTQD